MKTYSSSPLLTGYCNLSASRFYKLRTLARILLLCATVLMSSENDKANAQSVVGQQPRTEFPWDCFLFEFFDGVTPPELPPGWTAINTIPEVAGFHASWGISITRQQSSRLYTGYLTIFSSAMVEDVMHCPDAISTPHLPVRCA